LRQARDLGDRPAVAMFAPELLIGAAPFRCLHLEHQDHGRGSDSVPGGPWLSSCCAAPKRKPRQLGKIARGTKKKKGGKSRDQEWAGGRNRKMPGSRSRNPRPARAWGLRALIRAPGKRGRSGPLFDGERWSELKGPRGEKKRGGASPGRSGGPCKAVPIPGPPQKPERGENLRDEEKRNKTRRSRLRPRALLRAHNRGALAPGAHSRLGARWRRARGRARHHFVTRKAQRRCRVIFPLRKNRYYINSPLALARTPVSGTNHFLDLINRPSRRKLAGLFSDQETKGSGTGWEDVHKGHHGGS